MKDKVINELLKRISDLEFEVEKQEQRIDKAIEYIQKHIRIDDEYPSYMEMLVEEKDNLLDILKGVDKE